MNVLDFPSPRRKSYLTFLSFIYMYSQIIRKYRVAFIHCQIIHNIYIKEYDAEKTLEFVNTYCEKFAIKKKKGKQFVEVKTSLELCDHFMFPHTDQKRSHKSCAKLHVCRLFLEDRCGFGERCRKPHGFDNEKAQKLLTHHKLDTLSPDVLKILFQKVLKEHKINYAKSNLIPNASMEQRPRYSIEATSSSQNTTSVNDN